MLESNRILVEPLARQTALGSARFHAKKFALLCVSGLVVVLLISLLLITWEDRRNLTARKPTIMLAPLATATSEARSMPSWLRGGCSGSRRVRAPSGGQNEVTELAAQLKRSWCSIGALTGASGLETRGRTMVKAMPTELEATTDSSPKSGSLTFENVTTRPLPGTAGPGQVSFAPGGRAVTYLASSEGGLRRELLSMDISSGHVKEVCRPPSESGEEEHFTLEEKLRRERSRELFTGITKYQWAEDSDVLLVPLGGDLYVQRGISGELRRVCGPKDIPGADGAIIDPRLSADGARIAFVCNKEVYVVPSDGSTPPMQLTHGARGSSLTHGLADFLAQEEMNRYEGYWPSPSGKLLAYEEVDESHIPVYRIVHQGSDDVGDGAQEDHHYPFAGAANPKVRLGVLQTSGEGATLWFDGLTERFGDDGYLARVNWLPDGALVAQIVNRRQTKLDLVFLDTKDGSTRTILSEETDVWINLHDMFKPLKRAPHFLWASERSGFQHLYKYDLQGNLLLQLTSGEWMVESIEGVDEDNGLVYFIGTKGTWLESHLFVVPLGGGDIRQVTREPGVHSVVVDTKSGYFVDSYSATSHPLLVEVRSLADGSLVRKNFAAQDPRLEGMSFAPWEFFTIPSTDQQVVLQAAVLKPDPTIYGPGPYPTVVSVYGGPHVQTIANSWLGGRGSLLREQFYRQRGYLVLKVDNRGSSRRGLKFEGAMKHDMGTVEVADQVAGVRKCIELGLTDKNRVGIMGWSYGGYMSAMCLMKEPSVFKAACAGAPVTHWDGYDTCYTERYMGLPDENPDGYSRSAIMPHVGNFSGQLLLVHGLLDENVHFRHTARLINALIAARKKYELLLFPNERHTPRSLTDRIYMEEQIFDFFERWLSKP